MLGFTIQLFVVDYFGYEFLFGIMGVLPFLGFFILVFIFKEVNIWQLEKIQELAEKH